VPNYGGVQTNEKRGDTSYGLPIGTVMAWGAQLGSTLPPGWVICDGAPYLASAYPTLYSQMGQIHGNGTLNAAGGASGLVGTAFNMPDYRSVSHRGHNAGGTPDYGPRTAQNAGGNASGTGSFESHAIQGHWHVIYATVRSERYDTDWGGSYFYSTGVPTSGDFFGAQGRAISAGANGAPRMGKESRGINVSATYIIRAF
jgi:hypothetical protein